MVQKTSQKRVLFVRNLKLTGLGVLSVISVFMGLSFATPKAGAATSSTVNFQARLLNSSGSLVADGNYNVEFKLYDAQTSSGSSQGSCSGDTHCLWAETRTSSNQVRVVDGYLTVNLGSVNPFPSTIPWNQQLYLTMNIGGTGGSATWDGEMSPRLSLTAIPYAFQAGKLANTNGANTSTLGFASQTASNSILLPDESGTLCIQSSANCGFLTGSAANGSYVQLQSGSPGTTQTGNLNISGTSLASKLQAGLSTDALYSYLSANNLTFNRNGLSYIANATVGGAIGIQVSNNSSLDTLALDIRSNGNVGIGTSSAAYKLDVQGGDINTSGAYRIGGNIILQNAGTSNTFVGVNSGNFSLSGSYNYGIGNNSLLSLTTGNNNNASGYQALKATTTGYNNAAFGTASMVQNTTGAFNAAYGGNSLENNVSGNYNVAVGGFALRNATGSTNTALGEGAGYNATAGSGNVFLGYNAGYSETGSNKLYIANSNTSSPLVQGDFSASTLTVNGSLNVTGGYSAAGTAGTTTTCTGGNVLQNATISGGIVTGGSCAASGGGITGSGTANQIALFTGTGAIGNSILSQSGTIVTAAGTLAATSLQGDGSGVTNVNAATLQGNAASYFTNAGNLSSGTLLSARVAGAYSGITSVGTLTSLTASGVITSTVATGIAPFTVASTTKVTNLNADLLDGQDSTAFAAASGSSNYIQNGTGLQTANFAIQSASASSVGSTIKGASGQTSDLLQVEDSSSNVLAKVTSAGQISNTLVSSTGATLQAASFANGQNSAQAQFGIGSGVAGGYGAAIFGGSLNNQGALRVTEGSANGIALMVKGTSGQIGDLLQIQNSASTVLANIDASGNVNTSGVYKVGGVAGTTTTCTSGNVLQNATVAGGIITGGTCVANGGGVAPTLQNVYDNSSATPKINLSSTGKGLILQDAATPVGGNLFAVQNSAGTTQYLAVTASGVSVAGTFAVSGAVTGGTYNGQTISSAANFTGTLTVGGATTLNSNVTIAGTLNASSTSAAVIGNGTTGSIQLGNTLITKSGSGAFQFNAQINAAGGYQVNGSAPSGEFLRGDGTKFVASSIQAADIPAGSANYIQNGASVQSGANFNVSGNGTVGGTLYSNAVDTAAAGTLNLGASNATTINLGGGTANETIGIGNSSGNDTVNIATAAGTDAVNILTGSGTNTLNIGTSTSKTIIQGSVGIGTAAPGYKLDVQSGDINTSGSYRIGGNIVLAQDNANANISVGTGNALQGTSNTAIGQNALQVNTGSYNTAIGNAALLRNTTGAYNLAFGAASLQYNTTGSSNTAIGNNTLQNGTTSSYNTAIGGNALQNATNEGNTAIGLQALTKLVGGANNTAIGLHSGLSNISGSSNVFIGEGAGYSNTGSSNVFIGDSAGYSETGSNKLYIANSDTATPLIYGDFSSSALTVNGSLNVTGGYSAAGTAGTTTTCTGGNVLQNATISGGIVTGGTCVANGGAAPTLQNVYDNSATTNPQIQLSTANGGLKLRDAGSTVGNIFQIQNSAGTATYLAVTASGASIGGSLSASTSILAPSLDTASAGVLLLGSANATSISLGQNTSIASGKTFSVNGTTSITTTSASALSIQNAGSVALFTANTSTMQVVIGSGSNTVTLSSNGISFSGNARPSKTIRLAAEYPGAVLDAGTMSNNAGTMTSGIDLTNRMNFYKWTTTQSSTQSYDIDVEIPIPSDYNAANGGLSVSTLSSTTASGTIQVQLLDSSGTAISGYNFVDATPGTANTWTTWTGSGISGGTITPGNYITLRLRLSSPQNGDVQVGNVVFNYRSN